MRKNIFILLIFFAAFMLRFAVSLIAHHGDLNNNISWATVAYEKGLNGFYEGVYLERDDKGIPLWPYSAPNQPPLTILLFTVMRSVWQNLRNFFWFMNWELLIFPSKLVWFWDEKGMDLMIKLPSVLADMGIGLAIYTYFRRKNRQNTAIILSSLWLLNPVSWYNSAVWGQTDSIVNFLGLTAIILLLEKKLFLFTLFFSASVLFKGSLLFFTPILLFLIIRQKHSIKNWLYSLIGSLTVIIFSSIWFHPYADIFTWVINLYGKRILPGEIWVLSANAFNFWSLMGGDNTADVPAVPGSWSLLGISARIWGFLITFSGLALLIKWLSDKLSDKRIFFVLSLSALISFLFMTRMHERYLFPFFPYSTILLGFLPAFWPEYLVLSISNLINSYNLFWAPSVPPLESYMQNSSWIPGFMSIINILVLIVSLRHLKSLKV